MSRVGEGPFPSQIFGDLEDEIRTKGNEFGTTTKRPRNVGWLDLVQLKYAIRVSGVNCLALMLVDVLSNLEHIKVVTNYFLDEEEIFSYPALEKDIARIKPQYKTFDGFSEDITSVARYEDLPLNCRNYIEYIQIQLDMNIDIISVGPDRSQTILKGGLL
jgi:adenylosuccinate synthase